MKIHNSNKEIKIKKQRKMKELETRYLFYFVCIFHQSVSMTTRNQQEEVAAAFYIFLLLLLFVGTFVVTLLTSHVFVK